MDKVARCGEIKFSMEGGGVDGRVEGMAIFEYLGSPIDQTNDDWTAVRHNIMRVSLV